MTVEEPAGPELVPAPCRASAAAPCEVESRLRDALPPQAAPLDTSAPSASWADWFGDRACCPVLSTGDGVDATPRSGSRSGSGAGTLRATACSAADLSVARLGLGAALNLRFRGLASLTEGPCELVLQLDAERGLSLDEQRTLLRIAEESATQVQQEGSRELRVLLRRSRLGSVELSVAGGGGGVVAEQAAASFRSLARIRQLATQIDARLTIRRLEDGSLLVRCRTRWVDGGTGLWSLPR